MSFTIDLLQRYSAAFGFVASRFAVAEKIGIKTELQNVKSKLYQQYHLPDATVKQGNQVRFSTKGFYSKSNYCFADLALKCNNFEIQLGDFNYDIKQANSSIFVAPPMISTSREKIIKNTTPDRGEGEVVENFGKRSYEISLKGLIVDMENHAYPSRQVKLLRQFFEIDDFFEVVSCQIFEDLGIHSIYLEDWDDLSGVEGFEDTMSYTLKARSAQPVEYRLYGK
jgi:hypothetical protein